MTAHFGNLMRRILMLALFGFVGSVLLAAQSTTDGAIGGTVADSTGAVVAKAQVVIHNNGTNAEHTIIADDSGYYRVVSLQPGSYTVSVNHAGFAPFKAEQVIVQVGSVTEVSPRLKVGGGQETVEVSAEAPQINVVSPEFAPTLDQTAIANLPINGGRWSNFALLTPGVVSDSNGFGLISFRGISTLLNNNTVDGADNNQAFFSEERGRTRAGYSTAKVAVQEFQVNTSNYSAEYGRSAGGVINTVTKSGANAIHGEGYFYDRDNDWGAANAFTTIQVQTAPGVFTPQNFKPTDWRKMAGFGVGGALIKDKLFWYVAYDWYHRNFPGVGVASNPGGPGGFFTAPTAATISSLAGRLGITSAAATTVYNTDLAGLNTMLGQVPRTGAQNIFFPKIDWQINQKNHASFSLNRMRWSSPAGIQTQATVTDGIASFGNDYVKDTWGVAKLDTSITPNITNEARFQFGRDFEFENGQTPTPYENSTLLNPPGFTNPLGLPPQVSITNGFTFGLPSFLLRPAFPDETRMQIADTINWTRGQHNFKFGFDISHVDDLSQNLRNQFGSYSYSSLLNYMSDLNKPNTCLSGVLHVPCYSSYTQAFGPIGFEFATNDVAFFAADDWKVLPRLSLSLGLRWEYEMLPAPFGNLVNPAVSQTGQMPSDMNNFGPRVGFAWDIFGDSKTVLRGGYGIFYGRIINSTIYNALSTTGMPGSQLSFTLSPTSAVSGPCATPFPQVLSGPPVCPGAKPNIAFFGSNFQAPQIHQFDMTLERNLGWGTVLSVSYLGSLGRELPDFGDVNIAPAAGNITYHVLSGGPLTANTLTEPLFTSRINPAFGSMTDIFSGTNSSYHALVVQVSHRMNHHIQFNANYTWSHAIDFGQNQSTFSDTNDLLLPLTVPNAIALEKGNSIYDIPNRFVANAVMTSPWKRTGWQGFFTNDWEFDPIFQVQNGLPLNLSTSGSAPGGLNGGINGSGGAFRIDAIGRNTFRLPNTWVGDLRLAKHFKFQERYELEVLGDFFNIANKQNVTSENNTGYIISSSAATCGVGLTPCLSFNAPFGVPNNSNSNFAYSPRQIQLGVRVQF